MTAGERIKELMRQRGLTRREFAEAACVTEKTVRRWELGGEPGKDTFVRVYRALGVSMGEFWWGGEEVE